MFPHAEWNVFAMLFKHVRFKTCSPYCIVVHVCHAELNVFAMLNSCYGADSRSSEMDAGLSTRLHRTLWRVQVGEEPLSGDTRDQLRLDP